MGPKRKTTVKNQNVNKNSNADENIKKPANRRKKVQNPEPVVTPTESNVIKTREQQIEDLLLQKEINVNNDKYFSQEISADLIKLKSRNLSSPVKKDNNKRKKIEDEESDEDEDEWDDVEINDAAPAVVSHDTIEIKIDGGKKKKQNKSGFDFGAFMVRTYKNFQKKITVEMHKAHVVCWIYHGLYLNKLTTNKFINAIALSLCDQFLMEFKNEAISLELVNDILKFLKGKILKNDEICEEINTFNRASVLCSLQKLKYKNNIELILLILVFLRCLNIRSRLCVSFDVIQLKEETSEKKSSISAKKRSNKKNEKDESSSDESEIEEGGEEEIVPVKKKPPARSRKNVKVAETEKIKEDEEEATEACSTKTLSRKCKQVKNNLLEDDDDEDFIVKEIKQDRKKRKTTAKKEIPKEKEDQKSSILKPKSGKTELKKNQKVLSSDDDENLSLDIQNELIKPNDYFNYWIEVYLDTEERWISIDPLTLKFDCDNSFEKRLNKRILYVCSFDNDNKIKDVTKRYANDWNTHTRKLRIENFDTTFWFDKLLVKYKPIDYQISIAEDKVLDGTFFWFI